MLAEIGGKYSATFYQKGSTPEISWLSRTQSIPEGLWNRITNITNGFSLVKCLGLLISIRAVTMSSYLRKFIVLMVCGFKYFRDSTQPTIAQAEWKNPVRSVSWSLRNDGLGSILSGPMGRHRLRVCSDTNQHSNRILPLEDTFLTRHYWYFGPDNSSLWGTVLCAVRCPLPTKCQ